MTFEKKLTIIFEMTSKEELFYSDILTVIKIYLRIA